MRDSWNDLFFAETPKQTRSKKKDTCYLHQKSNGTESQRTPNLHCELWDTEVFSGSVQVGPVNPKPAKIWGIPSHDCWNSFVTMKARGQMLWTSGGKQQRKKRNLETFICGSLTHEVWKKNEEGCVTWIFCYNKMEIQLSKPIGVSLLAEIEVRKSPSFEPRTRFFWHFCGKWGTNAKKMLGLSYNPGTQW